LEKVVSTKLQSIKNAQHKVCFDYIISVFLKIFLSSSVFKKKKPQRSGRRRLGL